MEESFDKMDEINQLLGLLEEIAESNVLVVVEGYKDKRALEKFGIKNIMTLKQPLYKIIEFISENYKKCIVLTDLDKEGKRLYGRISKELRKRKVKVDDKFRNFLFKETKLRQIEGMWRYIQRRENHNS